MKYAGEFILAIFLALSASYAQAESIPINLRTFYADPRPLSAPTVFQRL
uniref:Uncharacterized protein n=1 Tax=uncultured Desulfobacterium sp. TaxID=201089 RepID=E1YAT7_9BACT|nr:unknown protein [uncultured Desulfobacterium sp.]